ncbi:hypothetical protein [Hydrogenophaga sp.]
MKTKQAPVTVTKNADGSETHSMKLSEMSLDQLEQVNQSLGRQRDLIREQMLHIRGLIDKKLAAEREVAINAEIQRLQDLRDGKAVDASAPGVVIDASSSAQG